MSAFIFNGKSYGPFGPHKNVHQNKIIVYQIFMDQRI